MKKSVNKAADPRGKVTTASGKVIAGTTDKQKISAGNGSGMMNAGQGIQNQVNPMLPQGGPSVTNQPVQGNQAASAFAQNALGQQPNQPTQGTVPGSAIQGANNGILSGPQASNMGTQGQLGAGVLNGGNQGGILGGVGSAPVTNMQQGNPQVNPVTNNPGEVNPQSAGKKQIQVGSGIINTEGLTPAQIQQVRDASKNGAGSKASAALAAQLQGKKGPGTVGKPKQGAGNKTYTGPSLGVNKNGTVDPNKITPTVTGAENQDVNNNFNLANPGEQTDQFGNTTITVRDPKTGKVTRVAKAGGPEQQAIDLSSQFLKGYQGDLSSRVSEAQNANYNYITKDYKQQQDQETEDLKQELANRGIPYGSDAYNKQMQQQGQKWQGLYDQAKNQAINAGNQTLATQSGVQNANLGALTGAAGAFAQNASPYQSTQTDQSGILMDIARMTSAQFMAKYGIDKQAAMQDKSLAAAAKANEGSGVVFNG